MKVEDIVYSKNNTHIPNSCEVINKQLIEQYVYWIVEVRTALKYPTRDIQSYVREWIGHNNLYYLGLFKSHTHDVDLEEPQSTFWKIVWYIIGR